MSIERFVQAMLPEFDKANINNDITSTRTVIVDLAIPAFEAAVKWDKDFKFKSGVFEGVNKEITVGARIKDNKSLVQRVLHGLKNAQANLDVLSQLVDDNFTQEVTAVSMTYKKANILQLVSAISSFADYSLKLLNILYICEANNYSYTQFRAERQREFIYLNKNMTGFVATLAACYNGPKDVAKAIDNSAELLVDETKSAAYRQTMEGGKLNAFSALNFTVILSPIYHVRMRIAEWQVARIKAARERKEVLQLRLLHLERQREGRKDAGIERQIEHTQSRIDDLDYKIKELTEA